MYRIGIDVGSTYTKYCAVQDGHVLSLQAEKTRLRQCEYFPEKLEELLREYPGAEVVACGYGKKVNWLRSQKEAGSSPVETTPSWISADRIQKSSRSRKAGSGNSSPMKNVPPEAVCSSPAYWT